MCFKIFLEARRPLGTAGDLTSSCFADNSLDFGMRQSSFRLGPAQNFNSRFLRCAWCSKRVKRAHINSQIGNFFRFGSREFIGSNKIPRRPVSPTKFALNPGQPLSVPQECFAIAKPAPNFDHVADDALTKLANQNHVFSQHRLLRRLFFRRQQRFGI